MTSNCHADKDGLVKRIISFFLILSVYLHGSYPSNTLLAILFLLNAASSIDKGFGPRKQDVEKVLLFSTSILIVIINSLLLKHQEISGANSEEILKIFYGLIVHLLIVCIFSNRAELLIKALRYSLFVLVIFWWLQFTVYFINGYYIDPLDLLGIRQQKYSAYFLLESSKFSWLVRPTSLFNEPGTYGSIVVLLMGLIYLYSRKVSILLILGIVSLFASLSTFSIIGGILFCGYVLIDRYSSAKKKWFLFFIGMVLVLGMVNFIKFYIALRSDKGYGYVGLDQRIQIINVWISASLWDKIIGLGLPSKDLYLEDSSLAAYLLIGFGGFSIPIIYSLYLYARNTANFILFSIIFLMKISLINYAFFATSAALLVVTSVRYGKNGRPPVSG